MITLQRWLLIAKSHGNWPLHHAWRQRSCAMAPTDADKKDKKEKKNADSKDKKDKKDKGKKDQKEKKRKK